MMALLAINNEFQANVKAVTVHKVQYYSII